MRIGPACPSNPRKNSLGRATSLPKKDIRSYEAYGVLNDDLVGALASTSTVMIAARQLGVSERTLHRHVRKRTGEAPSFWIELARARRALRALRVGLPLAEVAFDAGYADQAHFTRAFGARFGCSPAKFRRNPLLMPLAGRPGFAG
ncbi:helix-turn-helix domain-containing protein [Sinorhizobium meliloti]|uniref:helix-turn-helix domain-containing protein n=1 Tax=Rhizobium meliloti TaxID=382 RepID=UPI003F15C705